MKTRMVVQRVELSEEGDPTVVLRDQDAPASSEKWSDKRWAKWFKENEDFTNERDELEITVHDGTEFQPGQVVVVTIEPEGAR